MAVLTQHWNTIWFRQAKLSTIRGVMSQKSEVRQRSKAQNEWTGQENTITDTDMLMNPSGRKEARHIKVQKEQKIRTPWTWRDKASCKSKSFSSYQLKRTAPWMQQDQASAAKNKPEHSFRWLKGIKRVEATLWRWASFVRITSYRKRIQRNGRETYFLHHDESIMQKKHVSCLFYSIS